MKITFLGTGTSHGVPMIGCDCPVCTSTNPRNRRFRSHIHVEMGGLNIQVDAAPEFRLQAIAHRIPKIDLVILTHGHSDHILGMDDMRRYCDLKSGEALPVYSNDHGLSRMKEIYYYAICDRPVVRGYPAFKGIPMPPFLDLGVGSISSVTQDHGPVETLGLVFEEASGKRFAYYTDCNSVSEDAQKLADRVDLLVLDGLRHREHPTHMTVAQAVEAAQRIGAKKTYLIHMAHELDHDQTNAALPKNIELSYDGLVCSL
ncbi:MBL fold metallo-hydrolase [Puniceicoccaceae bacterium K14]|nr:MBL fold metallo-hydrolase [Puniceicoccaceae bacterium K14]